MARKINKRTENFIKAREAKGGVPDLVVYADIAGLATGGWGHRTALPIGQEIPLSVAESWWNDDIARFAGDVEEHVGDHQLNDNQFGALVAFAYNIGCAGFDHSTVLKDILCNNLDAVPGAMMLWDKITVNGQHVVSHGLENRRQAEIDLFNTPDQGELEV
jgi:lysozyme